MTAARILFILAAVPFTLLAALGLVLEHFLPSRPGEQSPLFFALCGGTYIYGTIAALYSEMPVKALVPAGLVLNVIGACLWLPAALKEPGIACIGLVLTGAWVLAIHEARHRDT